MSAKEYNLKQSKTFCMAPWVHTHIWPNGDVWPCCMGDKSPLTNYKDEKDLKSAWNSEPYKNLRLNMLVDKKSDTCSRCYEQESHGKYNLRRQLNDEFAHCYDLVEQTNHDGSLDTIDLRYLDIRFSNICNLACRTCGPGLSSSWGIELNQTNPDRKEPALIRIESSSKNKEFWNDLSQYIGNVERIYFAGGEPLLMQEHYNILDYLVERESFEKNIYYNTNFSTLDYKNISVLDYWKKFNNIIVCASLDGSYEKGEYIRKGLDWKKVIDNRKRMIQECPNVRFILAPTVSIFNADHVLDFYEEWLSLGLVEKFDIQFNVLIFPPWFRCELLPENIKESVVKKIDLLVDDAKTNYQSDSRTKSFLSDILQFKNALISKNVNQESLLNEFNKKIKEIDQLRGESFWKVFSHLTELERHS